jgi:hypothetical protein
MRSIQLLVSLVAVSLAAPALAQPAPAPSGADAWPQAISDRPYTLNAGMLEIHGAMPIFGVQGGSNNVLLGGGVSYGVSNELEIGGDYAFQASPSTDAAGVFAGHLLYRITHNSKMSAALGLSALYSHDVNAMLFSGGLDLRLRLTPQLSIFTDTNACGQCLHVAGPVLGQGFLAVPTGSGGGDSIFGFTVPAGVGLQVSPEIYLFGSTVIAGFILSPQSEHAIIFSDFFVVSGGGWLTVSNKLELGAQITDDVEHAGDNYFVELMARVFL